jgi:hypothetical protein
MAEERTTAVQRVRIGLTGLGFVFVAVLLAAAFTREPEAEQPITPEAIAGSPAAKLQDGEGQPREPLAELGVAPGNADANSANAAAPMNR